MKPTDHSDIKRIPVGRSVIRNLPVFIVCAVVAAVPIGGQGMQKNTAKESVQVLEITFPSDGDVLTRHDGEETDAGIVIVVRGVAPENGIVHVNGEAAARDGEQFSCPLQVTARESEIVAETGGQAARIRVWWNQGSRKRYRFSVDDNIQFLKDLGLHPERYPSLFDHWYLAFWREMHETYGAKIHLNIYYQTDGFDLTQMPDAWKEEWRANADWLHMTFHALQDKPDRPYRNAGYGQLAHDYDLVSSHIRRFAGNEMIGNTTTVHWAECPRDGVRALRDRGIENLVGIFDVKNGTCTTGYYFTPAQCDYANSRPAWHDPEMGVTFIPCAAVVNAYSPEALVERLDKRAASPHTAELIELLIHEQYFRKELDLYQTDIKEKVHAALRWVTENGYAPVFWSDGFMGTPEP